MSCSSWTGDFAKSVGGEAFDELQFSGPTMDDDIDFEIESDPIGKPSAFHNSFSLARTFQTLVSPAFDPAS